MASSTAIRGRAVAIVAAALAAVVVLAALADGRLLVADPDPSAVTPADVDLARSLLRGATPPDALLAVCIDDEGTIDPACLADGSPGGAEDVLAEVVPRDCREERTVSATCIERELGIAVPERCIGPADGVDVGCLAGEGTMLVLTERCLDGDRLRTECLTSRVYGVPDREGSDALLGLPWADAGTGGAGTTTTSRAGPAEPPETTTPTRARVEEDDGRSVGDVLAVVVQGLALALLAALAVYLLVVAVRSLRNRPASDEQADRRPEDDHQTTHDRRVMAASLAAGARHLDGGDTTPGEAIIAAYAALLEGLATCAQGRRPPETPLEHLERVLGALDVRPGPQRELTTLFGEARFSDHAMTDDQRERARAALAGALGDLDRVREKAR